MHPMKMQKELQEQAKKKLRIARETLADFYQKRVLSRQGNCR